MCKNCSKIGHIAKDCRARPLAMVQATPETMSKANVTCFGCGKKGHYRNECRESWNRGNQGSGGNGYNHGNRGTGGNRGRHDNENQRVEAELLMRECMQLEMREEKTRMSLLVRSFSIIVMLPYYLILVPIGVLCQLLLCPY